MGFMILEVVCADPNDMDEARKWSGGVIRDGDGLYMEDGRLFLVLASRDLSDPIAAMYRLQGQS
ncbi:MAG: hypothetical protein LC723_14240, partial [Actinobacteria bacterium]|nr:hypothetical protein [Actinomycetota bacterium]